MTNNDIRQFIKNTIYSQSESIQQWVSNKPIVRASLINYMNSKVDYNVETLLKVIHYLGYEIKIVKKKGKKQLSKQLQIN